MSLGRLVAPGKLVPLVIAISGLTACAHFADCAAPRVSATVCQLPVAPALGTPGLGGFLSYPGGSFLPDARSDRSYDHQMGRWLPVQHQWTSSDGRGYVRLVISQAAPATADPGSIEVVDLNTGQARSVWRGEGVVTLLGYTTSGIYFTRHTPNAAESAMTTPRLWVVDPVSGAARQLYPRAAPAPSDPKLWLAVTQREAWGMGAGTDGRQRIVRLDLRESRVETWSSDIATLLGFDSDGRPVVINHAYDQVAILTGPVGQTPLASLSDSFRPVIAIGDQHGIWFGGLHGEVWLSSTSGGLRQVGKLPSLPPRSYVMAGAHGQLGLAPIEDFLLPSGPCT